MTPDGIKVVEIDLALPGACYYLYWVPAGSDDTPPDRQALLNTTRATAERLDWKVFAAGYNTRVIHLLFQTVDENVNAGVPQLLRDSERHRLYLVQPETALVPLARHIHEQDDGGPYIDPEREKTLPEIYHGIFVGDAHWAEHMLTLLTRRSTASPSTSGQRRTLHEIDKANVDRHRAILEAYRSSHYNLKDIAEHFEMHFSEVSAVINASMMKC